MSYIDEQFEMEAFDKIFGQEYYRSKMLDNRIGRFNVPDEAVRDLLFTTSIEDLCELTDKVIMTCYPEDQLNTSEADKMIDIAAKGLSSKSLSAKQQWCLGSFCLYYLRKSKEEKVDE